MRVSSRSKYSESSEPTWTLYTDHLLKLIAVTFENKKSNIWQKICNLQTNKTLPKYNLKVFNKQSKHYPNTNWRSVRQTNKALPKYKLKKCSTNKQNITQVQTEEVFEKQTKHYPNTNWRSVRRTNKTWIVVTPWVFCLLACTLYISSYFAALRIVQEKIL